MYVTLGSTPTDPSAAAAKEKEDFDKLVRIGLLSVAVAAAWWYSRKKK